MKLNKLIMHDYWYCFTLIALAERKLNHINTKRFHNAKLTLISDYSLFVIVKDLAIKRFLFSWAWVICRQHEPTLCKWNTIPVMRSLQVTTWNEFLANHDITESFQRLKYRIGDPLAIQHVIVTQSVLQLPWVKESEVCDHHEKTWHSQPIERVE